LTIPFINNSKGVKPHKQKECLFSHAMTIRTRQMRKREIEIQKEFEYEWFDTSYGRYDRVYIDIHKRNGVPPCFWPKEFDMLIIFVDQNVIYVVRLI